MSYTNIRVIMDRLTRHPLLEDITFETVIDYTVDFIRIMGTPSSFVEKTQILDIKDYRGVLPCDYYQEIQVREVGNGKNTKAVNHSTDTFHMSPIKESNERLTYKIQGGLIITSIPEGKVELAYKALPIDEEGYPLIPDNSVYSKALELYIKLQWFTILFDTGKISAPVLNNTQQQYAWTVKQLQSESSIPSLAEMERIKDMWCSMIQRNHEFRNGFKTL